jgi:hypothetical protein
MEQRFYYKKRNSILYDWKLFGLTAGMREHSLTGSKKSAAGHWKLLNGQINLWDFIFFPNDGLLSAHLAGSIATVDFLKIMSMLPTPAKR